MNSSVEASYEEYKKFVNEFYPRTSLNCTQNQTKKLIITLFTYVEVIDVFIDILRGTNYKGYLYHIRHSTLLILYNLPNYNSFFISSLERNISEAILRIMLLSVGHEIQDINSMPFYRIQQRLKEVDEYKTNKNNFKVSCDSFFSYFGSNSIIMHSSSLTYQSSVNYVKAFNVAPTNEQINSILKFLDVIIKNILFTFSRNNEINDLTLALSYKIQLKKILGNDTYKDYFESD